MSERNFINMHVLISHSPSCLNRDDMNMQKTAVFGGVTRVRISSQSLKRAMRRPPEHAPNYWREYLGSPSDRTRSLEKLKENFIENLGSEFPREIITETVDRFAKTAESVGEQENEGEAEEIGKEIKEESRKQAVAPWVLGEIRELCRILQAVKSAGLTKEEIKTAHDKFSKYKGKKKRTEQDFQDEVLNKKIEKAVKDNMEAIRKACASAVDIALFGRMATSGLMTSVDGAMAVAHAITTHAVEPQDIDWFTAVDDLVNEAGEMGAGHLNTQQFSAGVFYRYASLNIRQLQKNLGDVPRKKALEVARHLFHMLVTVVPSAKQQSFAAHNTSDFAIASFSDQPISSANAFEEPVEPNKNGGYLVSSISKLANYWRRMDRAYALGELGAAFDPDENTNHDGLKTFHSLPEIEGWIATDGKTS